MSELVAYTPQSPSFMCSAWESFNSNVVTNCQWGLNGIAVVSYALNKLGLIVDYSGNHQVNERIRTNHVFAVITNGFFVGITNLVLWSSKYYQSISCSEYKDEYQERKRDISLKLISLINGSKNSVGEYASFTRLKKNYDEIFSGLVNKENPHSLLISASIVLKKYFPEESRLDDLYHLDVKQVGKYFEVLRKKVDSKEIDVTNSEKKVIDLWNDLFKAIK